MSGRRGSRTAPDDEVTIELKKKTDGSTALSYTRADGTVTWQHHTGPQAQFFPLHDLTHYAVETMLGHCRGFYGLVAEGWSVADFGKPWPKGPLPPEALTAELIVGFLDTERASMTRWSAADFNEHATTYFAEHGHDLVCKLSDDDLRRIRGKRSELFEGWFGGGPAVLGAGFLPRTVRGQLIHALQSRSTFIRIWAPRDNRRVRDRPGPGRRTSHLC